MSTTVAEYSSCGVGVGAGVASERSAIASTRVTGALDDESAVRWLWEGGEEGAMVEAWRRLFGGATPLPCGARLTARGGMPPGRMTDDLGRVACVARGSIRLGVASGSQADVLPSVVISGGQTGADRGALDAALDAGVPIGGWAPAGWRAEDDGVPERFRAHMREHRDQGYVGRTLQNILDGDATLIMSFGPLSGGSRLTLDRAIEAGRTTAQLMIDLGRDGGGRRGLWFRSGTGPGVLVEQADMAILDWIRDYDVGVLNVAGPRERKEPGIGAAVRGLISGMLRASRRGSRSVEIRSSRDETRPIRAMSRGPDLPSDVEEKADVLPSVALSASIDRRREDRDQAVHADHAVDDINDDINDVVDEDADRDLDRDESEPLPGGTRGWNPGAGAPARGILSRGHSGAEPPSGMSAAQGRAALEVSRWMRDPRGPQVYRLFGCAGTGKTTIARELAAGSSRPWLFASYTGKAALVMRQRGCLGAQTIHSLIYRPDGDLPGGPSFRLWEESPLADAAGIVIDECSMVDEELGRDLLSFGRKVLVLGDPAQLPPIAGGGFFTSGVPDFLLTEVFRQAAGSGILDLATHVREGGSLADRIGWSSEDCAVIRRSRDAGPEIMARMVAADQVIVGLNRTRHAFNDRYRRASGVEGRMPAAGDKVVCLRNERRRGLFNGSMWRVGSAKASPTGRFVDLDLSTLDGISPSRVEARSWTHHFLGREPELDDEGPARRAHQEFDYGYYVTCHKAQGSQWDDVVLYDESGSFDRDTARRWLYTGITRAARRLLVVA